MNQNNARRIEVPDKMMQGGAAAAGTELVFQDAHAAPFAVHGLPMPGAAGWGRFGGASALPKGLEEDAALSSGGKVSFVTNSRRVSLKIRLGKAPIWPDTPRTGSHALDLYIGSARGAGFYHYVVRASGEPAEQTFLIFEDLDSRVRMQRFTVNLPLFAPLEALEIGTDAGAAFAAPALPKQPPIVVYGGASAQGRGASRPGMAWCNILERKLGRTVLNLGCHLCPAETAASLETARFLAASAPEAVLYILHFEELCPDGYIASLAPFVEALRAAAPEAAVAILSATRATGLAPEEQATHRRNRAYARDLVTAEISLRGGGLHFLDGSTILGPLATDCLVDGRHLSDLGQMRLAAALAPRVARILRRRLK